MAAKLYLTSRKSLLRHKIFKFSFKIRYVYTPRVTTTINMYWVPVIHRLYIPQLNIFITRYNKSGGLFWSTCNIRWAIIWNEFSHGIKYQTFYCKKEYVSACDILVGIHSSDAEPGFKKTKRGEGWKNLTNRVAL